MKWIIYTLVRNRKWTVIMKKTSGGMSCKAWPGEPWDQPKGCTPMEYWTAGGVKDGLDEAIVCIDRIDGRAVRAELPRKVS